MKQSLKCVLKLMLLAVAIAILAALVLDVVISNYCDRDADRKVLDMQQDFVCPAGNHVVYEAWSECGLSKDCIDPSTETSNGSFFTAIGGRLQSKSLYVLGKQVEITTGYDSDKRSVSQHKSYKPPRN